MDSDPSLEHRLRDADSEELLRLLREHGTELDPSAARQSLLNPYMTREGVELLLEFPDLLRSYEVRREIAMHPKTPEVQALRLVPGLYWRDLVRMSRESRVRPVVRRAADLQLVNRLPGLAVGEKMSIARTAGPGVLRTLRQDPSPRVISAMLDNPMLTEGMLAPLVSGENAHPRILALIAEDSRWGVRYAIRVAVSRNPRTPPQTTLRILPLLKKPDLRSVAVDSRLPQPVRRRARVLLGEAPN